MPSDIQHGLRHVPLQLESTHASRCGKLNTVNAGFFNDSVVGDLWVSSTHFVLSIQRGMSLSIARRWDHPLHNRMPTISGKKPTPTCGPAFMKVLVVHSECCHLLWACTFGDAPWDNVLMYSSASTARETICTTCRA